MRQRIILLVLIVLLALALGFVTFPPIVAVWLIKKCGYWFIGAGAVLFGVYLVRSLRGHDWNQEDVGEWWRASIIIVVVAVLLHVQERHEFKIVMDEVVLQGTAMSMHFHREADVAVRAYDFAGNFVALNVHVDKRPLFFPFLLSLVHDLTGYRVANVFWLNGGLTLVFLLLVYLVGRRLGGWAAGTAAILLLATVPLINQNAVGGGFELLNLAMILLVAWLGMRYAELPSDDRLAAFVLGGALLAQVRYESVLFLLPVGATIIYVWWRQRRASLPWVLFLIPMLLVVYPWQYNVFKVTGLAWQLGDVAGATRPFGLQYFYENIGHAMNFFLCFDGSQPNSWLVGIAGTLGVGFFVLSLYKRHQEVFRSHPAEAVFCIFILGLLIHAAFMLCYFWGKWDDPIIRRLSLPTHLLLIFAFVYTLPQLVANRARWSGLSAITLIYIIAFTIPVSARHVYTQENLAARTNNWLAGYIGELGGHHVLAIDSNTGLQWIIHRQSSVTPDAVAKEPGRYLFHYRNRSFDDYFVVQRYGIDFDAHRYYVTVEDDLGDGFKLETIEQRALSPVYIVRLSRVVAIDEEKIKAWQQRHAKTVELTLTQKAEVKKQDADRLSTWLSKLP